MLFDTWLLFFGTSIGMALVPGPNGLLALTHGALYGCRKTLVTISGGLLGFVVLLALCMVGVGAIIQSSQTAFTILKFVGGGYLVWLGIKLWRSPPLDLGGSAVVLTTRARTRFLQGFFSAVTNPKAFIFYTALLPQFIEPQGNMLLQFAIVALTYSLVEFCSEFFYAGSAGRMRPWLALHGKRFNQVSGGIFMTIGAALPLRH